MNRNFLERIYKEAGLVNILLRSLGAAAGSAAAGYGTYKATEPFNMAPMPRAVQIGQNAILGAAGGAAPVEIGKAFGKLVQEHPGRALGTIPLAFGAEEAIPQGINLMQQGGKNLDSSSALQNAEAAAMKYLPVALGGAGLLGLGALGVSALNRRSAPSVNVNTGGSQQDDGEGKLHVNLPIKRPGDHDTSVELPLSSLKIPQTTLQRIGRDTRRRLRWETNLRTHHHPINLDQPSLLN